MRGTEVTEPRDKRGAVGGAMEPRGTVSKSCCCSNLQRPPAGHRMWNDFGYIFTVLNLNGILRQVSLSESRMGG